jgi:hypothetical protein
MQDNRVTIKYAIITEITPDVEQENPPVSQSEVVTTKKAIALNKPKKASKKGNTTSN